MLRILSVRALALVVLAAASARAQNPRGPTFPTRQPAAVPKMSMMASVDTMLLHGLNYRLVGHSRGGRVTTVTGVPSQPRTFYMGVASGGLFRTTDGGANWEPITDGQVPVGSMGSVAVSLSDPNTIYLGTGSDGVRSNVSTGRGIYKSTDAGKTWSFIGLYNAGQVGAVRILPTDPNTAWVAAYGDIFKRNTERGVFKTTDGGRTWKKTLYLNDSTGAMDVELQPGNPSVVYAWMNRIERKPWTIISGSREGGLWRSTDGGDTWTHITAGLPAELIGKGNIAVTAANPQRVYALVEAKPGGGLYRSDDAGMTWAQVNSNPALVQRPFYYTTLGADPTNADVVYAGAEGFFKSTDGGRTMVPMRVPHGDNHDIWVSPNDGNTMIQSNDGGANVSFDGGRTWSTQNNQVTSEIYGIWMDNKFPYNLYGAQQDNSTSIMSSLAGPYDMSFKDGPGCETGPIMPHPKDPNIVYGSCKGQYEYMSLNTGQSRQYWVGAQSLYGNAGRDLILRFQRVSPMATSPHDPDILYYGSQKLHRTRDKGVTWETISPDLTWNPPHGQGASGEPITRDVTGEEFYSTLYAITESPHEAGVIWVGANDGPFHITRDNGKTWTNITPKDLEPGGRVAWIDASPHRRGSAYYAVYRYLLGDYAPYLYKTEDYGKTWTRLTDGKNGIPADWPTRVVREDPDREGLLYAGTEFGMFVSFDNGAHWQPFNQNMPNVPINDIRVYRKDLVVATQGRGVWILDNLSALHQITPRASTTMASIYGTRPGYRTRDGADILGPMIEYYLPSESPVKIDILDAAGAVVNSYSSETPTAAGRGGRGGRGGGAADADPDAGGGGRGRGGPPPSRVTKNAGHNRFVWDLRHSSTLSAPPGAYTARVTTGSVTLSTPFTVLVDPRLASEGITVADLKEQFDHNLKMREMVAEVGRVRQRVQSTMTRLRGASGAAADTLAKVEAVSAKIETEPVRYGKPGLQAHINYLASMTSGTDQKIGRDAIARYAALRKELDAVISELNRIIGPVM